MEEARARGNEIIDQHQKALEGVFKTHKQEAVMQADTRIKTETASARQQLNTVTSKGQLKLRRQLSRVQNEFKNKFTPVSGNAAKKVLDRLKQLIER